MNQMFEQAVKLFDQYKFKECFQLLQLAVTDDESSKEDKSEMYNMLGTLIRVDPNLSLEDESGLEYFRKALEFDQRNAAAILNIIETFGTSPSSHSDVEILDFALKQIHSSDYVLSDRDHELIQSKLKIKNEILNNK